MTSFDLILNKGTLKIYIFNATFLFLIQGLYFLCTKRERYVNKNQWNLESDKHRLSPGSSTFSWNRDGSLWSLCNTHQPYVVRFIIIIIIWLCGITFTMGVKGLPNDASGKESTCQCRRRKRPGFNSWVRKIPWRRAWQPTPVFSPGELHGLRSLEGYSLIGSQESDMTEAT